MEIDDEVIGLFDTHYMHKVCDCVGDSAPPVPNGTKIALAQNLLSRVHAPMDRFIQHLFATGRGVNAVEFDAADRLRTCAENCAKILELAEGSDLFDRQAASELAEDLRTAWTEFIAHGAAYRMYDDLPREHKQKAARRRVNIANAQKPRKNSPTREVIEQYRNAFLAKHGTLRGWQTAASIDLDADAKTIRNRLRASPGSK